MFTLMQMPIVHRRKVEFSETDMAGIAHFANFFRWMEAAEAELFEQLGASLIQNTDGGAEGWPRVRVNCEFHAPVRFRDEIEVQLRVKSFKIRAVEYAFRFYKLGEGEPIHLATGQMTTVFARSNPPTGELESAKIAPALAEILEKLADEY